MPKSPSLISKDIPRWLYEVLRKLDDRAEETSQQMGAISRGESPIGGGLSLDLTDYLKLSGRPNQWAHGRNIFDAKISTPTGSFYFSTSQTGFGLRALTSPTIPPPGLPNTYVNVNFSIEESLASRTLYVNREWIFPNFNEVEGDTTGYHIFADTSDYQHFTKKTLDIGCIHSFSDSVVANNSGISDESETKMIQLKISGSMAANRDASTHAMTDTWPVIQFPAMDLRLSQGVTSRDRTHTFCILKTPTSGGAHTGTPFEIDGFIYGGDTRRELYSMYGGAKGTLPAPTTGSLIQWNPAITGLTGTFTVSSPIVSGITPDTTGIKVGMRVRESVSNYRLTEDTFVVSVDSSSQITMSQDWTDSTNSKAFVCFGPNYITTAALSGILTIEHSSTTDRDTYTVNCTTNGTTAVTSAALFGPVQVGHAIFGVGIPAGTTVTVVTDTSNITISQAATDSTTNIRNFASDDHTQLIRKFGPTNQFIGVQPAGTVPAGGLHLSGFLSVGSTVPVSTTETVHIEKAVTGVLTNFALFKMSHSGTGSVGSTHKTLLVQNLGAPSRSAGTPSFTGIDVQITPNCPAGLTDNILLGINMSAVSTLGGGSTINQITGVNGECGCSGTGTATLMQGGVFMLRPSSATVGSIRAIELVSSTTPTQTGLVSNMFGIYMDTLGAPATITGAGAITSFYGIYRISTVSATNKWFIYMTVTDLPSIHTGPLRLGDAVTPTHILELAAGTTTKTPILFTAGTNLTTALAGAMEWDGSRAYLTQTVGPTRKTIAYTTDSLPAVPGFSRIFATMGA